MRDDVIRLKHMQDAIQEIILYTKDQSRKDLDKDRKLVLSLVQLLEIVGEAATNLSEEVRKISTGSLAFNY